jgi:hypothetical protein
MPRASQLADATALERTELQLLLKSATTVAEEMSAKFVVARTEAATPAARIFELKSELERLSQKCEQERRPSSLLLEESIQVRSRYSIRG